MNEYNEALRDRVAQYIREGKLYNKEIADLCGVSRSYVERLRAQLGAYRRKRQNITRAEMEAKLFNAVSAQAPTSVSSTEKTTALKIGVTYRYTQATVKNPINGVATLVAVNQNNMHIFRSVPTGWIVTFTPAQMIDIVFEIVSD